LARRDLIAALDIGSSKICCFIGRLDGDERVQVTGIGHQASRGIKAGAIVDMDAAEESIMAAVHTAERMTGETVRDVVVGMAGGQPTSRLIDMQVGVNGGPVRDTDLRRLLYSGMPDPEADRTLLHAIPVGYSIDGSNGIRDPRGMHGQTLAVHVHQVTAAASAVRNVTTCVERCHLNVLEVVANPYAAGLAALVSDEAELGVTVIDMGGGATSIAVFVEGSPVFTDSVPVGGIHVTNDIARGLATPLAHAERLKTLHGSVLTSPSDDRETVIAPPIGEDEGSEPNHVPKSFLISIVAPRIEETLELARARLESGGASQVAGRRVVLVGGASQLPGIPELAARVLNKQVRIGRPAHVGGLAAATDGPAFAACAGLMRYSEDETGDLRAHAAPHPSAGEGLLARLGPLVRVGGWLRENL
jgi:cell division protein FtsA